MAKKAKSNLTAVAPVASDMKWRAESDARTIAEAEAVKRDPKRLKAASKEGARMGKEKMMEAKALLNLNQKVKSKF